MEIEKILRCYSWISDVAYEQMTGREGEREREREKVGKGGRMTKVDKESKLWCFIHT